MKLDTVIASAIRSTLAAHGYAVTHDSSAERLTELEQAAVIRKMARDIAQVIVLGGIE